MPRGWGFSSFLKARGWGFELLFCSGVGNSPIKKIAQGFCPGGGWSRLELTDTLIILPWLDRFVNKLTRDVRYLYNADAVQNLD